MLLRDATSSDFPQLLMLNEESVHFLSPLEPARLAHLHQQAAYHRVIELEGKVAAFLIAFREGSAYDSLNYQWFARHYDRFIYIDRVVVSATQRGQGFGDRLYRDLFSFAKQVVAGRVTCEFDIDPPNAVSRLFHERYGFTEVGSQSVASGTKRVSLQVASLLSEDAA
jgi:predicted GNAT superfamily acetyltransferase